MATFCGDKVRAAHDGTVLAAGRHFDDHLGWVGDLSAYYARLDKKKLWTTLPIVVVIDDGNGYRSVYAHFGKIVVKEGQVVKAGTLLGYEGRTGHATGCHLHYGLFSPFERATFALDPAVAKRMKLPAAEIARIDPRLVLPPWSNPVATGPKAVRRPRSPARCADRPIVRGGADSGARSASTPGSRPGRPPPRRSTRRASPGPAGRPSRPRPTAGRRPRPGRSRPDRARPGRGSRRARRAVPSRSYSARISASARQVGRRRRIASQPSATSRVTVPSPADGWSAIASPRAQRAARWSRPYSSRSA